MRADLIKKGSKVFLSYARSDREPARRIAGRLRKAGFEVWDPERELLPGGDWTSELKAALGSADAFVVLMSPEAMESRYLSYEIEYALGAKHLRGRLIPVMVRPTKDAPWILNSLQPVRYQGPSKTGDQIVHLLTQPVDAPQASRRAH